MALDIRQEQVGEVHLLVLSGRLDTDTSADLELVVQDLLQEGAKSFVVDLAGVGYVSSAGLRVLLMLGKSVDGKGGLRLSGLNATVKQVFDVAGFTQLFAIFTNRDAALAGIRAKPAAGQAAVVPGSALAQRVERVLGVKPVSRAAAAGADTIDRAALVARLLGVAPAR